MGTGFYSTGSTNWKAGKSSQGLKWVIGEKGMYGVLMIYHGAARWFMIHKNICNGVPRQRGQRGLSAWLSMRVGTLKGRIRTVISNIQTARI
jgi:hypothetical protein